MLMTKEELRARMEGFSIPYLAEKTGIHFNTLYRLKNDKADPNYETVEKLTKYFKERDGV